MTRKLHTYCIKIAALLLVFLGGMQQTYSQTALYVSKQTGEFSNFSGSQSKTTDKYENGSVSITTTGPIQYTVDPSDFSIGPNETKTWDGKIFPDVGSSPDPGNSVPAKLNGHYEVHFKSGGIWDADEDKWVTEGTVKDQSGDVPFDFIVYSIKVTLPDTICIGQAKSGTASAVPFPAGGGSYSWSVLSGNGVSLSNTTSQTVSIQLNDTTSVTPVKVVFKIQGVSYSAVTMVKYCRVSCNCAPITTGMSFGPIAANFTANPTSTTPDGQGFCNYSTSNASFAMTMAGVVTKQVNITGATLSFNKNCQTGAVKDVTINWSGDLDIGTIGFINLKISSLALTVSPNGNLGGSVTMNVNMNADKALMNGLVILRQGVNGNVTFNFNNTNGWAGSFDFSGVHNINMDIVKTGTTIASLQGGNLNSSGTFTGTFSVVAGASYTTDAFRITMNTLSLGVQVDMLNGVNFTTGSGSVTVDQMAHTDGSISLGLDFGAGNCNANINASNLKALSMTLSNLNLMADFNQNFDMTSIRGSLDAKHDLFDASISITEFEIKDGSLTKFNGSGKVAYKAFTFELINANYAPGTLTISAKVEINVTVAAALQVNNMSINDAGTITVGGISGSFNRPPVSVDFSATMGANRFTGTFNGNFTTIGVGGMIDIGAMQAPDYNFAYLSLNAGVNIPLGQSGLKISQLGGQFGMNYKLNDPTAQGGDPEQGTYVVGLKLGIADVANMCELVGQTVAQFGNGNVQLSLSGTLNVLKNNPYFTGNMAINYMIPANQISGSVSSVVNFPSNGWILSTNKNAMNFSVGNGQWSASGNNMTGTLLSHINLTNGFINFSGATSSGTNFTGSLGGKASAGFNYAVNMGFGGFNIGGNMQMNMNSDVNVAINQNGLNGSFGVLVNGSGTMTMSNWFFDQDVTVSGVANGTISAGNGSANLSGTMYVNLPFGLQPGIGFNIGI